MTLDKQSRPWDRIPNFRRRLQEKQVDELFLFVPSAIAFSLIGSIATLVVFIDTGDTLRGLIWFAFATVVVFFRGVTGFAYRQQTRPVADPAWWGRMMLLGNLLAGIQWGLLGTVLYPTEPSYREVFTVLVITSYVAGSITAYSSVKWVHLALALPATLPAAIYIFFLRDGNWLGGSMSLFFVFWVLFFSYKQYHIVAARLIVELDNEELLTRSLESNKTLISSNSELQLVTTHERRARTEASRRADLLDTHVARTLLPVAECDRRGNIVAWNSAAETMLGYRFREIHGQRLTNLLLAAEAQARDKPMLEQRFSQDRASSARTVMQTRNGQRLPMLVYITPMQVENGVPLRIGIILTPQVAPEENGAKAAVAA